MSPPTSKSGLQGPESNTHCKTVESEGVPASSQTKLPATGPSTLPQNSSEAPVTSTQVEGAMNFSPNMWPSISADSDTAMFSSDRIAQFDSELWGQNYFMDPSQFPTYPHAIGQLPDAAETIADLTRRINQLEHKVHNQAVALHEMALWRSSLNQWSLSINSVLGPIMLDRFSHLKEEENGDEIEQIEAWLENAHMINQETEAAVGK